MMHALMQIQKATTTGKKEGAGRSEEDDIPLDTFAVGGGYRRYPYGRQTLATQLRVVLSTIRIVVISLCRLAHISRTVERVIRLPTTTALTKWNKGVSLLALTSRISHDVRQILHVSVKHQVNLGADTCNSVPTRTHRKRNLPSARLQFCIIRLVHAYAFSVKKKDISVVNVHVGISHRGCPEDRG